MFYNVLINKKSHFFRAFMDIYCVPLHYLLKKLFAYAQVTRPDLFAT